MVKPMTGNILHKDWVDPDANLQEFRNRNTYKHQTVLCNGVLSALSLNSGCLPQLTKRKKLWKGKGCQARCYARLAEKVGTI